MADDNQRRVGCGARILLAVTAVAPAAALAQFQAIPGAAERQLLERQQYQEELLLRQRQGAELNVPNLPPARRMEIQRDQAYRQQRQRELHDRQDREHLPLQQTLPQLTPGQQAEQLLYEGQRFEREREAEGVR
jgi:hypothetical protein